MNFKSFVRLCFGGEEAEACAVECSRAVHLHRLVIFDRALLGDLLLEVRERRVQSVGCVIIQHVHRLPELREHAIVWRATRHIVRH